MHKIFDRPRASARGRAANASVCRSTTASGLRPFHRTVLALSVLLAMATGQAAETPSFGALLQQAHMRAPQLLEQAANLRAASADVRQAAAWLNPTVSATAENLGAPAAGGVSQRQDTYAVTQVLEIGGKRAARIDAEQRKFDAASAR